MENFCKEIDDAMFECEPIGSHYFCKFFKSLEKHNVNQQDVTSTKLLNPENGETPDKFLQENEESAGENLNVELIDKYSLDFGWLAEQIEGHNCRNLSSIFYLNIIKKNRQQMERRSQRAREEKYPRSEYSLGNSASDLGLYGYYLHISIRIF
ncbi:hypothetical protein OUZ56_016663 [Daphnia magna]|uniref:Uncharacterized protein n=1 Tax=Daphnia magna TaxID=35525 RepID=A0ABR0AR62_9CRUS|nr:hypothetical protein OUZ56_016663 [Daphnia magna]